MTAAEVQPEPYDLIIVGAGIVGASLAAALCQQGPRSRLRIALVDGGREPRPDSKATGFDPRVVAISPASQQLFKTLQLWSAMESPQPVDGHNSQPKEKEYPPSRSNRSSQPQGGRACPYTQMYVWDGEGTGHIRFDSRDMHRPNLGYIIENSQILALLLAKLRSHHQLTVIWGDKLVSLQDVAGDICQRKVVRLQSGKAMSASLVVAADGANSTVRKLCGIETREWDYQQQAIVATVRTEHPHQFTAWQRFMQTGPLAFLPLLPADGDDHYCSIVWSLDDPQAVEILALPEREFAERLAESFEYKLGAIVEIGDRYGFPLRRQHAKQYIQPGLALLGDAAPTIHPLAGQGVNLGLLDVIALVSELDRALCRGIPLHDMSILRRYQRTRRGPNLAMMLMVEGLKHLFGSPDPWIQLLRNSGMTEVNKSHLIKTSLVRSAAGMH